MGQKKLLWSVILLFTLGSCDETSQRVTDNEKQTVVYFTSVVEGDVVSRATGTAWTANDYIGVFMKQGGKELNSTTIVEGGDNVQYVTKLGDGNFRPNGVTLKYPDDGSAVDFIAYYPYQATLDGYIYKVDVANQSEPEAIDLLYADNLKGRTQSSVTGNLQFYHQLAQLTLNLSSSDNTDLTNLTVSITGMKTNADFNIANGSLTVDESSQKTINMRRVGNAAEAILLPTATVEGIKLILTLDGKTKEVALPSSITSLEQKTKYSFSINVKNGGSQIDQEEATYVKWRETPVITKSMLDKSNIHYINHYIPGDSKVRNYSLLYDSDLKLAHWVAYPYCSYYDGSSSRTDEWQYDPGVAEKWQTLLLSSYGVSGYSRGHQIASADRLKDAQTNATTFYYTNMTPQVQDGMNGGIWANLEAKVRGWATDTIFVVTGASVTTTTDKEIVYFTNKNDDVKVAVPKYYYKALARKVGGVFRTIAFKLENKAYGSSESYMNYSMSVSDLETETGFTFFPTISADIKATHDKSQWQ